MRKSSSQLFFAIALGFISLIPMTSLSSAQPGSGMRGYGWGPVAMMGRE